MWWKYAKRDTGVWTIIALRVSIVQCHNQAQKMRLGLLFHLAVDLRSGDEYEMSYWVFSVGDPVLPISWANSTNTGQNRMNPGSLEPQFHPGKCVGINFFNLRPIFHRKSQKTEISTKFGDFSSVSVLIRSLCQKPLVPSERAYFGLSFGIIWSIQL